MAKDISELNKVYEAILGKGDALTGDEGAPEGDSSKGSKGAGGDEAYKPEDYSDDAGDGTDPREDSGDGDEKKDENKEGQEALDDDDEESGKEEGDDDDDSEVIPERLVSAGRRAKLDDKTIIELAETRPEILEALAKNQEEASAALAQKASLKETPKKDKDDEKDDDINPLDEIEKMLVPGEEEFDDLSPKARQIIQAMAKQMRTLSESVKNQSAGLGQIQEQAQKEAIRKIDVYFDGIADTVPALGITSKKLTQEQVDARLYAYRIARGAQHSFGGTLSDEEALAIGVNALKGSMNEAQLRAKLVSDLNRNKKRFTSRYKGRSGGGGDSPRSADDRARAAIDKVLDDPKYKSS